MAYADSSKRKIYRALLVLLVTTILNTDHAFSVGLTEEDESAETSNISDANIENAALNGATGESLSQEHKRFLFEQYGSDLSLKHDVNTIERDGKIYVFVRHNVKKKVYQHEAASTRWWSSTTSSLSSSRVLNPEQHRLYISAKDAKAAITHPLLDVNEATKTLPKEHRDILNTHSDSVAFVTGEDEAVVYGLNKSGDSIRYRLDKEGKWHKRAEILHEGARQMLAYAKDIPGSINTAAIVGDNQPISAHLETSLSKLEAGSKHPPKVLIPTLEQPVTLQQNKTKIPGSEVLAQSASPIDKGDQSKFAPPLALPAPKAVQPLIAPLAPTPAVPQQHSTQAPQISLRTPIMENPVVAPLPTKPTPAVPPLTDVPAIMPPQPTSMPKQLGPSPVNTPQDLKSSVTPKEIITKPNLLFNDNGIPIQARKDGALPQVMETSKADNSKALTQYEYPKSYPWEAKTVEAPKDGVAPILFDYPSRALAPVQPSCVAGEKCASPKIALPLPQTKAPHALSSSREALAPGDASRDRSKFTPPLALPTPTAAQPLTASLEATPAAPQQHFAQVPQTSLRTPVMEGPIAVPLPTTSTSVTPPLTDVPAIMPPQPTSMPKQLESSPVNTPKDLKPSAAPKEIITEPSLLFNDNGIPIQARKDGALPQVMETSKADNSKALMRYEYPKSYPWEAKTVEAPKDGVAPIPFEYPSRALAPVFTPQPVCTNERCAAIPPLPQVQIPGVLRPGGTETVDPSIPGIVLDPPSKPIKPTMWSRSKPKPSDAGISHPKPKPPVSKSPDEPTLSSSKPRSKSSPKIEPTSPPVSETKEKESSVKPKPGTPTPPPPLPKTDLGQSTTLGKVVEWWKNFMPKRSALELEKQIKSKVGKHD